MAALIGQAGQVRSRRTMAEMEELRAALVDIVQAGQPMTVRQVFYQMVVRNLIEKTEGSYNDVVVRLLVEHRRAGRIPWEWITGPRFPRYSRMYRDPAEILRGLGPRYRRYRWDTQPAYVSIWVEKEALAETLLAVTDPLFVKLWPGRGRPGLDVQVRFRAGPPRRGRGPPLLRLLPRRPRPSRPEHPSSP